MRQVRILVILIMLVMVLAACAAGTNPQVGEEAADGTVAGFWLGLWHGIIAPITFVVSLFNSEVNVYEVYNNGGWYNFGFVLGAGVLLGGGSSSAATGRRRSRSRR